MKHTDKIVIKQNNKTIYRVVEKTHHLEHDKRYGIAVYSLTPNGEEKLLSVRNNLTEDKDGLQSLVELCNRLKLSPIHLDDVVEDFLT
jgi:DNA-binding PadR family transcriptional regulator